MTHNHRQGEDKSYAETLNRIRVGEQTEDDINILRGRVREEGHPDLPSNSIRIYSTVAEVVDYNLVKMAELPGSTNIMKASHFNKFGSNFQPNIDKAGRISDTQFLDCLHLKLGARVMLIHNTFVSDGLVNGAVGELNGVIHRNDGIIEKLIIKFDNEQAGEETRKAYPSLASKYPGGTPIFRKEIEYSLARSNSLVSSTAKFVQFPVIPAFAVTCHRFQGQTILYPSKVVVDLRKIFQAAQAYVMLSRVQSLEQLYILGSLPEKKLYVDTKALAEVKRLEEVSVNNNPSPWDKEDQMSTKLVFLNTRSIKNKFEMIKTDHNLLKAEVILLTETWLNEGDQNVHLEGYRTSLLGGGRGGGTAAFLKSEFLIRDEFLEDGITLTKASNEKIDIINIYRAQSGKIDKMVNIIKKLLNLNKTTIIGGDIIICFLKKKTNPFIQFLLSLQFSQLVKYPTHLDGGSLIFPSNWR